MWELSDGVDNGDNQELVISSEMEGQLAPITEEEYNRATAELAAMTFDGNQSQETESVEEQQDVNDWNWYIDTMFEDIVADLMDTYGYSYDIAVDMIYNSGLEIHSAMDPRSRRTWRTCSSAGRICPRTRIFKRACLLWTLHRPGHRGGGQP